MGYEVGVRYWFQGILIGGIALCLAGGLTGHAQFCNLNVCQTISTTPQPSLRTSGVRTTTPIRARSYDQAGTILTPLVLGAGLSGP